MANRVNRWMRTATVLAVACLTLSACAAVIDGKPSSGNAPNAHLDVINNSGSSFDQLAQNALTDIEAFWKINYPKISGGKPLPPLKGGYYSIDGLQSALRGMAFGPAAKNACYHAQFTSLIDNAAYCEQDDSIGWDRSPTHLFAQLEDHYGPFTVALIFAHEFGHAIQDRLGTFNRDLPTIDTESQADCAAGAWAASAIAHQDPHFRTVTAADLDHALNGFLDGRDPVPQSSGDVSHGDGFDRLSAIADGLQNGVTYCYSPKYFDRTFTERGYTDSQSGIADKARNGNEPLSQVIDAGPVTAGGGGLQPDLNRFWSEQAKAMGKPFTDVKIAEAAHPKCGASADSEFGYCPDDNTVYYSSAFAKQAYNSLPDVQFQQGTGNATLIFNSPSDYALGTLFVIGWGLAVRHQFSGDEMDTTAALLQASCYAGAYSKDINVTDGTPGHTFTLSPPDLDEAASSILNLVGLPQAYGARGTTGLDRIQSFVKGYNGTLSAC